MKISTFIKSLLTIIAITLTLFGWITFMLSAMHGMGNSKIEKYAMQKPLNDKNGLVVDSAGNIYIGESEAGCIQVYNNIGNFLYGFSFPTGGAGWFAFGISNDNIHVVTARTNSYFVFYNGNLIDSEENITYERSKELQEIYQMSESKTFVLNEKSYKINLNNTITIQDKGSTIRKVKLATPIWPLPIFMYWLITALGMGLTFALHHKFFLSIVKSMR